MLDLKFLFKKKDFYSFVFLFVLLFSPSFSTLGWAQNTFRVQGLVTDQMNSPLSGVSVFVKNGDGEVLVTNTDSKGAYDLVLGFSSTPIELVFRLLGFDVQVVLVDNRIDQSLPVRMVPNHNALDEVVIVGYGKQSREKMTVSISKLDPQVLENTTFSNAGAALQGTISGVRAQAVSGQPGASPRIIVRGGTSINNPDGANPLFIIDGVIRQNMDDVESRDIATLQVLKDAASTAIYGARGSNGVVIVTTKTGQAGKTVLNFNNALTMSDVGHTYDLANAEEFIRVSRLGIMRAAQDNPAVLENLNRSFAYGTGNDLTNQTAFSTQYLTPQNEYKLKEGWKSMVDPVDPSKTLIFEDNDWQDLLYRRAIGNSHYVSMSGGTEKALFNTSLGYYKDQGIAITTDYHRMTFQVGGQIKINDRLKLHTSSLYARSGNSEIPNMANTFYRSAGISPAIKFKYEDGSYAPGTRKNLGNLVYHLGTEVRDHVKEKKTLAVGADYSILKNLTFSPQLSYYNESGDGYTFQRSYWDGPSSFNTARPMTAYFNKHEQFQADGVFLFNTPIATYHHVDASFGFSYYNRRKSGLNAAGQGASTDLIPTLNAAATPTLVQGSISDHIMAGLFYRVNYDYKNRYLVSVTGRYDGASNLGQNYQWGLFPAVSAGWNLHQESFWNDHGFIRQLKLRGSYGINGNISNLSDFHALGDYQVNDRYLGNSAIQRGNLPNSSLKWERSRTVNLGVDLGLGTGGVHLLVDVYRRQTDDLITSLVLPPSTGYSSIFTNLGALENKGIEMEINSSLLPQTSKVKWQIGLNVAYSDHKILSLPDNGTPNNRIGGIRVWDQKSQSYVWKGGLQEGGRIGDHYAWKMIGVYSTTEEANQGPKDLSLIYNDKQPRAGDAKWLDVDKNGIIDDKDRVYLGNSTPKWTGGWSNSLSYGDLSLYTRIDFMAGHTIYNYASWFMHTAGAANINMTKKVATQSWTQEGDVAKLPAYQVGATNINYFRGEIATSTSSVFYEKGDFLSLREISVTYSLRNQALKKAKLDQIKVRLSGNNLIYFTKYSGLNPEDGNRDNGRYPVPRTFTFGLDFIF